MELSDTAQRVLGCLVEKALATPNQYPMSRNQVVGACNQSTGRDPVVVWDEPRIRDGLTELKDQQLAASGYGGGRVPKYEHRLAEQFDLAVPSQAVLSLLLLRGPQTVGELRNRSGRLHDFGSLDEVEHTLASLADHKFGALVTAQSRQPGQKEIRWSHLLGGAAVASTPHPTASDSVSTPPTNIPPVAADDDVDDRLEMLELRVETLESQLADALDRLDQALG